MTDQLQGVSWDETATVRDAREAARAAVAHAVHVHSQRPRGRLPDHEHNRRCHDARDQVDQAMVSLAAAEYDAAPWRKEHDAHPSEALQSLYADMRAHVRAWRAKSGWTR